MKLFKSKHSYMKTTWILNLGIVFICISAIFIGLASFYTKKRLDSFLAFNIRTQEGFQSMIDHSLDTVRYSSFNTFFSPDVQRLRQSDKLDNYEMIQGTRALNALASTNSYIHSVYVYNQDVHKVFTTHQGAQLENDFSDIAIFDENYEQPRPRKLNINGKEIWVYTLTFKDFKENHSSLIVNINAEMFNNSIFTTENADEYIYIPSIKQTFYSDNNEHVRDIDGLADKFVEDNGYIRLGNGRILFYSSMPTLGWTFVKEIDQSLIGQSDAMILSFSFIMFAIIAIMFSLLYLNIKKRYHKPLTSIIDEFDIDQQEASQFANALHQWISSQKMQEKEVKKTHKYTRLETIITGNCDGCCSDIDFAIDFETSFYITIFDTTDFINESFELYMESIPHEALIIGNETIIFTQNQNKGHFESLSFTFETSIIQSNECTIESAKESYDNLIEIKELSIMNPTIYYRDESNLPNFEVNLDQIVEYETAFLQSLIRVEQEEAWHALNNWYKSLSEVRYTSILFFYNKLFVRLRGLILEAIPDENIISIREFEERIQKTKDIKTINQYIETLAYRYLDYHESKKELRIISLINSVKDFIDHNMSDPNFSSNSVSDEFELTTTHLSRLFKTHETYSVSEYITNARLEKACHMLSTTDESVKNIAKRCGIINTPYFYTLFKKHFNCSPSEYRNEHKE